MSRRFVEARSSAAFAVILIRERANLAHVFAYYDAQHPLQNMLIEAVEIQNILYLKLSNAKDFD
jgi:hypothetical protein